MKNANEILKENPVFIKDLLSKYGEDKVKHLIWLGQVEVINHVAVNDEQKLELLKQVRWVDFLE